MNPKSCLAERVMCLMGGASPKTLTKLQRTINNVDKDAQRDRQGFNHFITFSDGSVLGVRYRRYSLNKTNQLWVVKQL